MPNLSTHCNSSSGNPDSENVYDDALNVGSKYSVLGLVKNKYGNFWYKVADWTIYAQYVLDGEEPQEETGGSNANASYIGGGYLYSGDVSFSSGTDTSGYVDWRITEPLNYPTTHTYNTTFPISGEITAPYSGIRTVHAEIRNSSGIVVSKSVNPGDVHSYNLYKSEINSAMTFKSLAKGSYTYEVSIVLVYYAGYSKTRTEYLSNPIVILSKDFTVTDGTDNSDDVSFEATKTAVNRFFYASSNDAFMYNGPSSESGTKTITLGAYGSRNKVPQNSIVYVDYVGDNKNGQTFYHLKANTGYICDVTDNVYVAADKLLLLPAGTYRVNSLMQANINIKSAKDNNSSSVKLLHPGDTFTTTAAQDGGIWVDATCSDGSGYIRIGYGEFVSSQTYTVSFNANGGTNAPSALTFISSESVVLPSDIPSRIGFVFVGWSSTTGGAVDFLPGEEYSFCSDTTLYAVWQEIVPVSVTVSSFPTKTEYEIGEMLDTSGLVIKVTYSDDSAENITSGFAVSGFSSASAGQKVVTVLYMGMSTQFTVIVNEPPVSGGRIVVESKCVIKLKEFTVTVSIEDNPGFAYLELTPNYSPELTLVSVKNGSLISDFTKGVQYVWAADEDTSENGILMTFTFMTSEQTEAGSYSVGFTIRGCYNDNEASVALTVTTGNIEITDVIYGDANGDGLINGQDVLRLKRYLANYDYETGTSTVLISPGADANGDEIINGQDVLRLKRYLANYDYNTGTSTVVLGPNN